MRFTRLRLSRLFLKQSVCRHIFALATVSVICANSALAATNITTPLSTATVTTDNTLSGTRVKTEVFANPLPTQGKPLLGKQDPVATYPTTLSSSVALTNQATSSNETKSVTTKATTKPAVITKPLLPNTHINTTDASKNAVIADDQLGNNMSDVKATTRATATTVAKPPTLIEGTKAPESTILQDKLDRIVNNAKKIKQASLIANKNKKINPSKSQMSAPVKVPTDKLARD